MPVRLLVTSFLLMSTISPIGQSALADGDSAALPRSTPEAQGVSSTALREFITAADEVDAMHSFMLVRHGHVVAEGWWTPYAPETQHILYSLSKSFASTAVGLAIAEGHLNVDDTVLSFFPDEAPAEPSDNLRAMLVRDLLRMNTGHESEPALFRPDPNSPPGATWTEKFFMHPVAFPPGEHFLYNSPATYMQSAIVQKVTGMTLLDYLAPRLFEPLGIEDPFWVSSPEGINAGAYGLQVRTEDLARFGQLYLQQGEWQGQQLIPADWVREATSLQTTNGTSPTSDWNQGYGYQFWLSRHNAYRGDGAFGQYCLVLPDQDAVVVITSGVRDMQGVLNLVWDKLLPAFNDAPLPEDEAAEHELQTLLAGLTMTLPVGESHVPMESKVSGQWYKFPENDRGIDAMSLAFDGDTATLRVRQGDVETSTPVGLGRWPASQTGFANGINNILGAPDDPLMSAAGAWSMDDIFTIKLVACETPFYATLTFQFDGNQLLLDAAQNVSFGPNQQPQLVGEAATE